ncbi:MAG: hypothetical protein CSA33_04340 [Desulfobulbus propionicus]|nr:MAG: hypothetical protein CSA33_04340 [Desulfobulbus propionicus]
MLKKGYNLEEDPQSDGAKSLLNCFPGGLFWAAVLIVFKSNDYLGNTRNLLSILYWISTQ